jgi:pectin methylesterase-like acyl-CoA thioesterase
LTNQLDTRILQAVIIYEPNQKRFQKTRKIFFMRITHLLSTTLASVLLSTGAIVADPLNGEYTIGNNGDFKSVNAAVKTLQENGVSGPVWLMLEKGNYKEKLTIGNIKGTNAMNVVTFESKTGNSDDVVIETPADGADYIVLLNAASFIAFENITLENSASTYGNVVRIEGDANGISFKGAKLNGVEGARTGANNAVVYCNPTGAKNSYTFDDTEFNNGSYGLYKSSAASAVRTMVSASLFFNQHEGGIKLSNETSPVLASNVISTMSNFSEYKAMDLDKCNSTAVITNNIINAANGRYGIFLNDCSGSASSFSNINGNSISVGGKDALYGVYLNGATDNQLINFNRVKLTIDSKQTDNQAYYKNASTGTNVNLTNNLFYDLTTGGYTILGNTYKDFFNQLPSASGFLSVSANGITIEKVTPIK